MSEGEYILSVNGIKTVGMKHDEIINLLRNAGDQVLLELEYQLPETSKFEFFMGHSMKFLKFFREFNNNKSFELSIIDRLNILIALMNKDLNRKS